MAFDRIACDKGASIPCATRQASSPGQLQPDVAERCSSPLRPRGNQPGRDPAASTWVPAVVRYTAPSDGRCDSNYMSRNRVVGDVGLTAALTTSEGLARANGTYRVFISHGSADGILVTDLIAPRVIDAGANVFVDSINVEFGGDYHDKIFAELEHCHELCVLLTPTSVLRPWVFAEIGAAILRKLWVVAIVYGVSEAKLQAKGITSLLGTHRPLALDDMPRYIDELRRRIASHRHV